jgi:hypothetical protein
MLAEKDNDRSGGETLTRLRIGTCRGANENQKGAEKRQRKSLLHRESLPAKETARPAAKSSCGLYPGVATGFAG